jgi:YgiT-type zinc finger domain-containing protein
MIVCETCQVGRCQPAQVPYLCWLGGRVVNVPGVPALVCDVCGEIAYDEAYLDHLEMLLEDDERQARKDHPGRRPRLRAGFSSWPRSRRNTYS